MGGGRGHFNPSPWDQRQNTFCKSGPEDLGARWLVLLCLLPSMHFLAQAPIVLISSVLTSSAPFQGGKVHLLGPRSPCLTQRQK